MTVTLDDDGVVMVTRREAARRVSVSVRTIAYALASGDLGARRVGNKVLIPVDELHSWAESLPAYEPRS